MRCLRQNGRNWPASIPTNRLLHELEGRFQKLCGSPRVALRIGVVPDTEKKEVLYTNAEKAQYLMSQNGDVKNLITDLGLDIK